MLRKGFEQIITVYKKGRSVVKCLSSSKDTKTYLLEIDKLPNSVILINENVEEVEKKYPYAYKYLNYGIKMHINECASCKSRNLWYSFYSKKAPDISFNSIINDFGKSYKGNIYPKADGLKSIYVNETKNIDVLWYYLNSSISWLIQQIIIRSNFGDGAGDIKVYELKTLPILLHEKISDLKIDLGETKNYKEELGSLENLDTVNPERLKLDNAILEAIGYKNKKERDKVLLELYKATFQLIDARLKKSQSLKGVKAERNNEIISQYTDQLINMLLEGKFVVKNTITFGNQLEKLVSEITMETKLQKRIIEAFWKDRFGESYNKKTILQNDQTTLF